MVPIPVPQRCKVSSARKKVNKLASFWTTILSVFLAPTDLPVKTPIYHTSHIHQTGREDNEKPTSPPKSSPRDSKELYHEHNEFEARGMRRGGRRRDSVPTSCFGAFFYTPSPSPPLLPRSKAEPSPSLGFTPSLGSLRAACMLEDSPSQDHRE